MNTIIYIIAWMEVHPALMQFLGIITGASIALIAATIAYKGVMKQIRSTEASEIRSRLHEQITLYKAFAADLDALKKSLDGFHDALIDDAAIEGRGICKSVFLSSRNVVWESCAHSIGALNPNHAANIIETYRYIDAIRGRINEINIEDVQHRIEFANFLHEATKQIDIVLKGLPIRPDGESADTK